MKRRRGIVIDEPASLPPLGDEIEFMRLVWAVERGLESASKQLASSAGVTWPQRLALHLVGRFPGVSAGQLASALHLHPSTLTGILRRLERRHLLSRRADPRDGRRAAFGLTPSGRQLDLALLGSIEPTVRRVLSEIPPSQVRVVENVLARLARSLGVECD
jgi:MarR family transcriptional regulator, organic hydroperoxide resistance regulator